MKISTRGQYALESVIDLALHTTEEHDSLKNISKRRDISENYLEQIFAKLRKNGIVESVRGAQGGYKLARDPSKITAGEVIRALEGPFAPVKCIIQDRDKHGCKLYDYCVTRTLWAKIMDAIDSASDSVTIKNLAECCKKNEYNSEIEYYI